MWYVRELCTNRVARYATPSWPEVVVSASVSLGDLSSERHPGSVFLVGPSMPHGWDQLLPKGEAGAGTCR